MAEQNPLLAQYAGARQVAQGTPMRVSAGQGMAPGQVAQYLQGNALNVAQRLDGRANNMVESDPAVDIRARERFQEQMDQQVYADNNAMTRAEMDLKGQRDIAESNNALTRELGFARIGSAENMQDKELVSKKELFYADLDQRGKELVEKAREFDSRLEFDEWAEENKLSENEANRIFAASENDKKLIEGARQFDTLDEWRKDEKAMDLDEAEKVRIFEASQSKKERASKEKIAKEGNESRESVAFKQLDTQLEIAGMDNATRKYLGDMQGAIDKERTDIMRDEVILKGEDIENRRVLGLAELEENRSQFNKNIDLQFQQLDAQIEQADDVNMRMLQVARMQLDGAKYNVDKSYELKMLERGDEANRAANIQPVADDMLAKVMAWKSGGLQQEQEKLEAAFIMSNAAKIQGIDITTLYKPNGNPNPVAIAKAKTAFYGDPANASLRDSMNQFVSSGIQATTTQMNELERLASEYKFKYAPATTPPGNSLTAPLQGQGGFTPQFPPGFQGVTP